MFSGYESHLGQTKRTKLADPKAWHNLFHTHIVSKIDESRFSDLFSASQGRPNAPVRILLGMIFLKEGYRWSDEELFEQCGYNLLVMRALGLVNLDEQVPAPSTYYLFKQQVFNYNITHGVDLVGQVYSELTESQAHHFGVRADFIRMDSKLFGSNIATCCRLQLILGCLRSFWKTLTSNQRERSGASDRETLDALLEKQPHQVVYGLQNSEKAEKLQVLGQLLERLIRLYSDSDSDGYEQIARVFSEHYAIDSEQVVLKQPKDIAAQSLQSPHDPDATYCCKPGQKVRGYKVNLTETCNPEGLNLVTDVQVTPATQGDPGFVVSAIEKTQSVAGQVTEISMDGSYHHPDNQEYAVDNKQKLHISGMPGYPSRYTYEYTDQGVAVTDTRTGEVQIANEYKPGKYSVIFEKRYSFTEKRIQSYLLRKQVEEMPGEVRKRRANVEATIYHLSCYLNQNKTRYRCLQPNRLWATARAVWINLTRIGNYLNPRGSLATA